MGTESLYYAPRFAERGYTQAFRDCATLQAAAEAQAAGDCGADLEADGQFYILQLEMDLLLPRVVAETDPLAPRILGGINQMAITRVFIATRDDEGRFVACGPPEPSAPSRTLRGAVAEAQSTGIA